jgi:V-type H+-transporting ATPase proteolipid subunit
MRSTLTLLAAAAGAALAASAIAVHATPTSTSCDEKFSQTAAFFGAMGCAASLIFANLGAAYGTAKSAVGISFLSFNSVTRGRSGSELDQKIMRSIVPVVMAGILGIYGLIVAVIINSNISVDAKSYTMFTAYVHAGAGLAAGLTCLASGLAIGIVGDYCTRAYAKQDKMFVGTLLVLTPAGAIGLYGLMVALVMINSAKGASRDCL